MDIRFGDRDRLDEEHDAMGVVMVGQGELCLDYIVIAEYMRDRGFPVGVINAAFSVWAGREIKVAD